MNEQSQFRQEQIPFQAAQPNAAPQPLVEPTPERTVSQPTSSIDLGASLLRTILPILAGATLLVYLTMITAPNPRFVFVATTLLLAVEGLSYGVLVSGRPRAAGVMLSGGLWLVLAVTAYYAEGIGNAPYVGLVLVVLIAGLVIGGMAGWTFAALNVALGLLLLIASLSGILPPPLMPYNAVSFWIAMSVISFSSAGLIFLAVNRLRAALAQSQRNERAQAQTNRELQIMRTALEQQVAERTRQLQERAHHLEAAVEINRATSSTLDREQLMQVAVNLLAEQFALDYAGLYLVDPTNTWAVLRAERSASGDIAISEPGPQAGISSARIQSPPGVEPQSPTQVALGSGLVGLCIANAQPRLTHTDMPAGSSDQGLFRREAAIPLRSRGKIIGALQLIGAPFQRTTFDETEVIIFQAISDQIAIALENAYLYQGYVQAQEEIQRAGIQASREAWSEILRGGANLRYRYDRSADRVIPIQDGSTTEVHETDVLQLPIPVRDQVVGTIRLIKGTEQQADTETKSESTTGWNDEEITLLKDIIEQLGIALDSSRLYQDTQRLAYREQLTTEVTTRIRETLNIETVLRTAVQEIQKTLNLPEVVISLASTDQESGQNE